MSPSKRPGGWRLLSVTVNNFRGVMGTRTYRFDGFPALIYGDNGVGKSTLALALEYTMFGRFPSQSFGAPKDSFLAPVGGSAKPAGEVVFVRGGERLVVRRDDATDTFTVDSAGEKRQGEDASTAVEQALGLDMDTFVRAVLLQQSKIRGLLLDEPKERNKALDRLLGMEDAEVVLDALRPKPFKDAAYAWREHVEATEAHFTSQQELLTAQYAEAQQEARDQKFLNKDLTLAGLKAAYAELDRELTKAAKRNGVDVDALPEVDSIAAAKRASNAVATAIRRTRAGSDLQRKLLPVQKRLAALQLGFDGWRTKLGERDAARAGLERAVASGGDADRRSAARVAAESAVREIGDELRTASELRSLLLQAKEYLNDTTFTTCPVCEQDVGQPKRLVGKLALRAEGLTTKSIQSMEKRLEKARAMADKSRVTCEELDSLQAALKGSDADLESARKSAMKLLETDGLVEKKVSLTFDKAIDALQHEQERLATGVRAMEEELEAIEARDRRIRDGLLPFLETRAKVERHEKAWKKAKEDYAADEEKAAEMDAVATDIDMIRKALLGAKEEIAKRTLGTAGPRAQVLYGKLVQHPLFDRLDVQANRRANKVDYSFEVSSGDLKKSAREARLVLSDGQLTAAALALFYALAESSQHHVDLLYIDDPTQNLDHPRKEAMAKIVVDLSTRKQVVVSSQDEDFVTLLKDAGFHEKGVVHQLTAWDRAPKVATTMPSRV